MKNRLSFVVMVSLLSCANVFGGLKETFEGVVDRLNWPVEKLLELKNAPLLKEVLDKDQGRFKSWHRVPKTALTMVLAYFVWKNDKVRTVASKVAEPVKRAMRGCKSSRKKETRDMRKHVAEWEEEEKA